MDKPILLIGGPGCGRKVTFDENGKMVALEPPLTEGKDGSFDYNLEELIVTLGWGKEAKITVLLWEETSWGDGIRLLFEHQGWEVSKGIPGSG